MLERVIAITYIGNSEDIDIEIEIEVEREMVVKGKVRSTHKLLIWDWVVY